VFPDIADQGGSPQPRLQPARCHAQPAVAAMTGSRSAPDAMVFNAQGFRRLCKQSEMACIRTAVCYVICPSQNKAADEALKSCMKHDFFVKFAYKVRYQSQIEGSLERQNLT
jgi:hypothetical protein